jgi:hypothetical protein
MRILRNTCRSVIGTPALLMMMMMMILAAVHGLPSCSRAAQAKQELLLSAGTVNSRRSCCNLAKHGKKLAALLGSQRSRHARSSPGSSALVQHRYLWMLMN